MTENKHIILIDDDPIVHMACEMILYGSRYRKTSIMNPEEAMMYQRCKDKYDAPDLMLIDLMMGKVSGIDVIRSIRTDPSFDNIPILLYTGYHEKISQDINLLKELNIACILPKPITKEQFLSKIDTYIGSK